MGAKVAIALGIVLAITVIAIGIFVLVRSRRQTKEWNVQRRNRHFSFDNDDVVVSGRLEPKDVVELEPVPVAKAIRYPEYDDEVSGRTQHD